MGIISFLVLVLISTSVCFFWSWYVRKYKNPDAFIWLYVTIIVLSNIIAYKIAAFDFGFFTLFGPAATIFFSITFLVTDIVNEKFGRKETQKMIYIALFAQLITSIFVFIAINLNSAPFWTDQTNFQKILWSTPRIMLAGWTAFIISESMDAYIFSYLKNLTNWKYLWIRNIFSSIPSMAIDSTIFVTLAFYWITPLLPLIFWAMIIKWIVAVINIPFMYLNRYLMK